MCAGPDVESEVAHAGIAAVPEVVRSGDDLREAVDGRAVFDFVVQSVRRPPRTAERVAQAVNEDVIAGVDAVGVVVEGIVGGRRTVEVEPQYLAAVGIEILCTSEVESIAHVDV